MSFMENKVFGIAAFAVLIEGIISYISEFFVHGSFLLGDVFEPGFGCNHRSCIQTGLTSIF